MLTLPDRVFRAAAVLALAGGVLAGCGGPVDVAPGPDASSAACQRVVARWPGTVGGQTRGTTDAAGAAVWGDPAIIARCGMSPPGPTTDPCIDVDGVFWVATELEDGYRLITYGRAPALEILAPDAYRPQPLLLPAFTEAARALPRTEHACYGPGAGASPSPAARPDGHSHGDHAHEGR